MTDPASPPSGGSPHPTSGWPRTLRRQLVALTPWQRGVATFGSAAVVLVLGSLIFSGLKRVAAARQELIRTYEVAANLERAVARLVDAETAHRGYLLTGDQIYLSPFSAGESG